MMNKAPQQQVEEIFHSALELAGAERAAYLAEACAGDESLSGEVESLIAALESGNGFMEQPAFELGIRVLGGNSAESMTGKEVGGYKILNPLGKGGMGEVYLAEDTRLGRKVALKFLSSEFVGDNWAKRQLIKEAQAVAMLDHPNICAVHGIEEIAGQSFIVMQYVEGETLADLIRGKSLPLNQVLPLARQIVSGLAEAHAHGIIHRDIKPKNIMVTPSGQIKVLDFGLAKTIQKQPQAVVAESVSQLSQAGLLVGTIAYMSPEQLRGEKLDYRSDIFSTGTVLYEMARGKNPYSRETNAEIISAILTLQPSTLKQHLVDIPLGFDRMLEKCLKKERNKRYQSAADLLMEIDRLEKQANLDKPVSRPRAIRMAAVFTLFVLLAIISVFIYQRLTMPLNIAVLPISNQSGDQGLDYLSDGVTSSLIDRLSGLARLRIKSLTVVSGYKDPTLDLQKVGNDLKVEALLTGRVTGSKDAPLLQVTLISVADGTRLWSSEYQVGLNNVFLVEREISEMVASRLEPWSSGDRNRIRTARRPEDPEAFRQYLLGKYYWSNRNSENIKKAITSFDAAIKLDPLYAQAWAGLADCYALMNTTAFGDMPTEEAMKRARTAANKALEIDGSLAEAHTSLGVINLKYDWNWLEAENYFRQAINLKPDYAPAHYWYSILLTVTGRKTEALSESEMARTLDPFSVSTRVNVCREFYYFRQYERSLDCLNTVLQEEPGNITAKHILGFVAQQTGRNDRAIEIFEGLPETTTDNKLYKLISRGYAYGKGGRKNEAQTILDQVVDLSRHSYVPPHELAVLYLGVGDNDQAFFWLNKACDERFATMIYLTVDPAFDQLRGDPRFLQLASRIKLPLLLPANSPSASE
jgi:serine/threonine protein kinase/Tfp pilus assembly protein PilF